MFTGIVEELGTVRAVVPNEGGARIEINATTVLEDAVLGASIAAAGSRRRRTPDTTYATTKHVAAVRTTAGPDAQSR